MYIAVSEEDFDLGREYQELVSQTTNCGGTVLFIGRVRDFSDQQDVKALVLSHYPGMTEKVIQDICNAAQSRWSLSSIRVIHRVGELKAGDQIVLVAVAAEHREDAFLGAEYIMDELKTNATFWKKEKLAEGERWLEMKNKDIERSKRWKQEEG